MAPICELCIPSNQYSDQPVQKHIDLCNMALDSTLTGLEIPDPNDRELRIRDSGETNGIDLNEKKVIRISYTCGTDEYGVGKIFNPSYNDVTKIARDIFNESKESKVDKVVFKGFENSIFINFSSDMDVSRDINMEIPKGIGTRIPYGNVRLYLSPRMVRDFGIDRNSYIEKLKLTDSGEFYEFGKKMCWILGPLSRSIVYLPTEADVDLAIDIELKSREIIPREDMLFLKTLFLHKIIKSGLMNRNGERSGNLWIKQWRPTLIVAAE